MKIHIPDLSRSPYPYFVLGAVFIGLISACLLMKKAKIKRTSMLYTVMLCFVCIFLFAVNFALITSTNPAKIGFSGIGGALGVVIGVVTSCFIHKDHPKEMCAAFIVSSPLMYSLSKFGCLFAGCCHGRPSNGNFAVIYPNGNSYFPAPLMDILMFMAVYLILLTVYFKSENKIKVIYTSFALLIPVRFISDYFRESHGSGIVSLGQIEVLVVGLISVVIVFIGERINYGQRRT